MGGFVHSNGNMFFAKAYGICRPAAEQAFCSLSVKWRPVPGKHQVFHKITQLLQALTFLSLFSLDFSVVLLSKHTSLLRPTESLLWQHSTAFTNSTRRCLMKDAALDSHASKELSGACCLLPERRWHLSPPERPYCGLSWDYTSGFSFHTTIYLWRWVFC